MPYLGYFCIEHAITPKYEIMANAYKTPGVYIETPTLPSIKHIDTAVPVFLGFTEKFPTNDGDSAFLIHSVSEFISIFGGSISATISEIKLDSNLSVSEIIFETISYLFDAITLYFSNGGAHCYVQSIGTLSTKRTNEQRLTAFLSGLESIQKIPEITLVVAPDAVVFPQNYSNKLRQAILQQCANNQQFALLDCNENQTNTTIAIEDFRSGIGEHNLSYGAVYAPWLLLNTTKNSTYKDIHNKLTYNGTPFTLTNLSEDKNVKQVLLNLDQITKDYNYICTTLREVLPNGMPTFTKAYNHLEQLLRKKPDTENLKNLLFFYLSVSEKLESLSTFNNSSTSQYVADISSSISTSINTGVLARNKQEIIKILNDTQQLKTPISLPSHQPKRNTTAQIYFKNGLTDSQRIHAHFITISSFWTPLKSIIDFIQTTLKQKYTTIETDAIAQTPLLKHLLLKVSQKQMATPPSGAIAGLYALNDRRKGVWAVPANMHMFNIKGLTTILNQQDDFNLLAKKAINPIKKFKSSPTVWGARTLAANHEYRFISTRRLMNTIITSVTSALFQFSFEPNNEQTWTKARQMITNYLSVMWQAGAFVGRTKRESFFVLVGEGTTMNEDQIQNGHMIISIGIAPERPSQFTIENITINLSS